MLWGSIAPDIMPFYKFIRHYKNESINYISKEIANLIILCQKAIWEIDPDPMLLSYISKKIGIISHYLCDYTCYPHAQRITCSSSKSAREHLGYEIKLNNFSKDHEFNLLQVNTKEIYVISYKYFSMRTEIKNYINDIVEEYMNAEPSFETDLNYALMLNIRIIDFVFNTIENSSKEWKVQLA